MGDPAKLESENRALRAELAECRTRCVAFDGRVAEIRADLEALQGHAATLENLFVASSRLHGSLDTGETLRALSDILRDLIGARRFDVSLQDESGAVRRLLSEPPASERGPDPAGPVVARTPLTLAGKSVGEIVVFELFSQKKGGLTSLDRELLSLLGDQAAAALLASRIFSEGERRAGVLREFVKFLVESKAEA